MSPAAVDLVTVDCLLTTRGAASTWTRAAVAWGPLLGLALAKLSLHLLSNGPLAYGYMSDEFYYLDCANHLAWGYVDHPPLSIAVLWLVRVLLGDSGSALRLVPALAGCAAVVLAGLMARELGGGGVAQGLAGLAVLVSPVYLAVGGFYSMNAIEPALWALAGYLLLRLLNGADPRTWLLLGMVMGLGLLNKISMLWLGFGLFVGLALTPQRRWLATPWPWLAGAMALLLFAPHIVWQVQHGWPTLEFMRNATRYKMVPKSPLAFLGEQLVVMHPLVAPFWLAALIFYFAVPEGTRYRPVAWIWVSVGLLLSATGSARSYYMAPAYVLLFPAGGVAVARLARAWSWPWMPAVVAAVLTVGGVVSAPLAIPLLPPVQYIGYERAIGVSAPKDQIGTPGRLPLHFALRFGWQELLHAVSAAYASLPPEDQKRAGILTQTFGEAGAINFLGRGMGLPAAIGTHNNYWLWGPGRYSGEVMIVVARPDSSVLQLFEHVQRIAPITCDLCMPTLSEKSAFVCRNSRRTLVELWPQLRDYW